LYAGSSLGLIGAVLAWGSYMYIYNEMKLKFDKYNKSMDINKNKLSSYQIAISSLTSGINK
jgi:hypothetical protein